MSNCSSARRRAAADRRPRNAVAQQFEIAAARNRHRRAGPAGRHRCRAGKSPACRRRRWRQPPRPRPPPPAARVPAVPAGPDGPATSTRSVAGQRRRGSRENGPARPAARRPPVQLALEPPRFVFLRVPLADDEIMHVGQTARRSPRQRAAARPGPCASRSDRSCRSVGASGGRPSSRCR